MQARAMHRGRTMKSAVVENIDPATADEAVLTKALSALGENRSSIFGWQVIPQHEARVRDDQTTAVVVVHTD